MNQRLILTCLWVLAFAACVLGVERYIGRSVDGVIVLLPEDRLSIIKPILVFYGAYLGGILGFWYKPVWPEPSLPALRKIRFWLALACTLLLNAAMVSIIWQNHLDSTATVQEDVQAAIKVGELLSFLAAPANLYYFGIRRQ